MQLKHAGAPPFSSSDAASLDRVWLLWVLYGGASSPSQQYQRVLTCGVKFEGKFEVSGKELTHILLALTPLPSIPLPAPSPLFPDPAILCTSPDKATCLQPAVCPCVSSCICVPLSLAVVISFLSPCFPGIALHPHPSQPVIHWVLGFTAVFF